MPAPALRDVRRRLAAIVAVLSVVGLTTLAGGGPTAGAHTIVLSADPSPGAVVEEPLDRVVLEFLDPVLPTPTIDVLAPDGSAVPGITATTQLSDTTVEATFDPLVDPGRYQVRYTFASLDGVPQDEAHEFTFAGIPEDGDGSGPTTRTVLAAVTALALLALAADAVRDRASA